MVWIKATYEFGSLFSYRIPGFSSQYALSSILPGISTIKLAIVSTAIETTRNIEYGKEMFEIIKNNEIRISLPKKVAQTNVLIKRLKKKKGKSGLETTFGIRGYIHYPEKFNIYLNSPEDKLEQIEKILRNIRRFGTSDSLVWCSSVIRAEPSNTTISAVENLEKENNRNVLLIPVKDITPKADFEDINIYNKKRSKKDILSKKMFLVKLSKCSQGKNWMVYELA